MEKFESHFVAHPISSSGPLEYSYFDKKFTGKFQATVNMSEKSIAFKNCTFENNIGIINTEPTHILFDNCRLNSHIVFNTNSGIIEIKNNYILFGGLHVKATKSSSLNYFNSEFHGMVRLEGIFNSIDFESNSHIAAETESNFVFEKSHANKVNFLQPEL